MKRIKLKYIPILLALSFSCGEGKSTNKKTDWSPLVKASISDTLKFTTGIRAIFQDSRGNYWIGSKDEGVAFYDGIIFHYITKNEGLVDNQIRSIQEDKNGKIWIGTAKGASVFSNGSFYNYITSDVKAIYDWNNTRGDLWFNAGEEEGVNRFDGKEMNYLVFPKPKYENQDNTYGVTDISVGNDGKVWIATYAALFNYNGNLINIFDAQRLKLKSNELLHIRSVLADSKGRVWVGNNGIGVLLIEDNSVVNFSELNGLIHSTSTRRGDKSKPGTLEHVFAIEEDSEGNIWFGDRDAGAWKYDGNSLTNYSMADISPKPMIWTIYNDNKNQLLFGMEDGDVLRFNGKTFEVLF